VQVNIEPQRVLIAAARTETSGSEQGGGVSSLQDAIFAVAKWPSEVDPSTGSAYLKDGTLTVAVKRALPVSSSTAASSGFENNPSPEKTTK
jgi:hypothetical protein